MDKVKAWQEDVVVPTYPAGLPEKNPMFLEKRVYQGSSGVVYPNPIIEKISDERTDKTYKAIFLENRYLRIMILPELGGRIQMAYDKIKERHFIYYNRVIKPALVGLTGPWISGGIEFNWPQHHRPSTFEPVDSLIKENPDGSVTVWINEIERMFHTKGMAGFTLHPDKAYLEIQVKLYNRTPLPQTFLWWANPAVKVNDQYQSVFPPDVYAVFDHGKRDVSEFPIAKGMYYKVDYSPGTDISRYKNIPVPTSFMAISSKYDFIGGYEHDTGGGILHVADHHVSPGKKQWTWGNGDFGRAWDRNLTDDDGPYIELMTGVFTDNQPDFSWLQPFEEKSFVQYFMPYQEVGMVKNASKDIILGFDIIGDEASIRLYATSSLSGVKVQLCNGNQEIFSEIVNFEPGVPYITRIKLPVNTTDPEYVVKISEVATGRIMLSYEEEKPGIRSVPSAARAAAMPSEIENNEQLFLTGQHLEQYRHATYDAFEYYEEALRRDSRDVRCNNAMGLWNLRRGQFARAASFFRKAIATLTERNPNPYDGEPYYNLALALKFQNNNAEAFDAFYKSTWNDAWQHAGYLQLARIAASGGDFSQALELARKSLMRNYQSPSARHLLCALLRKLGDTIEALKLIDESLETDPFNYGCIYEKHLLLAYDAGKANEALLQLKALSRNHVQNFLEYALDYASAGLTKEASGLLSVFSSGNGTYTLVPYYLGWFAYLEHDIETAVSHFHVGALLDPSFIFPNRLEELQILNAATKLNPGDAKACYYLGNFWYDKHQYDEAIVCWEKSAGLEKSFPTVHRNLALAYYNKRRDPQKALESLEKAFALDKSDARVLMELDQLYKILNINPVTRIRMLGQYRELVSQRDDLLLEQITLYNQAGDFEKASALLDSSRFHPWEGGEGRVVKQYLTCHLELAKQALETGRYDEAGRHLKNAENYPPNLGEGKLPGVQENDIFYLKGLVLEKTGQSAEATLYFELAARGISEPVQAVFYNDPQPDKIFYQGLAWRKLNQPAKAEEIFRKLIEFGNKHLDDEIMIDYFAVSLPDLLVFDVDLNLRNRIHCLYMMALGYLGLGSETEASELFGRVLELDVNHQGSLAHSNMAGKTFWHD
jgi:tetratricopeptide (TPR) repeat protein